MKFEYVGSALTGYLRLATKEFKEFYKEKEFRDFYDKMLTILTSVEDHDFSVLYNAFTENKHAEFNRDFFGKHVKNIYSDSGGLQMVTLGKKSVNKLDIFENQSKYSNIGMSFDDIPIKMLGDGSISNVSNRYYDPSLLIQAATNTANDLKTQINFMKNRSGNMCKPMMIIQGNDFDSYQTWVDIHADILTDDEMSYIQGVSLGGAALGIGFLDDIKKTYYYTQLKFPTAINQKHIHLLGIGAMYRFLPFLALKEEFKDTHISYDSTTHSCTVVLGDYYTNFSKKRPNRYKDAFFYQILSDMNDLIKDTNIVLTEEDLYNTIWYPKFIKDLPDARKKYYTIFAYFTIQAKNFMLDLNLINNNQNVKNSFLTKLGYSGDFYALEKIRDINDFNDWVRVAKNSIPSNPIKPLISELTLEDYFV